MCSLIAKVGRSTSTTLKALLFCSYHKVHMTQSGVTIHTLSNRVTKNGLANTPKDQALTWAKTKNHVSMFTKNNEVPGDEQIPCFSYTYNTNQLLTDAFFEHVNCQQMPL